MAMVLNEVHFEAAREGVEALLRIANGRRTSRVLSTADVEATVAEALASPLGYAWRDGGNVDDARQLTTVCLAVVSGDDVTVGVGVTSAQRPAPDRAWPELEAWDRYEPAVNRARCLAWAGRTRKDRLVLPRLVDSSAPRATRDALLQAVLAAPEEDAPRLVYADWLLERGDVRGEFITLQCAAARLPEGTPERVALEAEARALVARHWKTWMQGVSPDCFTVHFERGFMRSVTVLDAAALPGAAATLDVEPLQHLTIAARARLHPATLSASPWIERLSRLAFHAERPGQDGGLDAEDVHAILGSRRLRALKGLHFHGQHLDDVGALVLAVNVPHALPGLEELSITQDGLTDVGVQGLASSKWLGRLKALDLSDNPLRAAGAEALVVARSPLALSSLVLDGAFLGNDGARALAASLRVRALRTLSLKRNRIGPGGAEALLDAPGLSSLSRLALDGNAIGAKARRVLGERGVGG